MGSLSAVRLAETAILVAFVVTIVYTDWRWRRIPNAATYPVALAGLVLGALEALPGSIGGGGLVDHIAGLVLAFLVSWPLYAGGGMKAGDGKFLMAVGALRGVNFLIAAAFYGAIAGGIVALLFIVGRRLAARAAGESTSFGRLMKTWIPYGVALGIGALLALAGELAAGAV